MTEQRSDYPSVYRFIRGVFSRPPIPTKIELRHISEGRNGETQAQINSWETKEELNKPNDEIAADIIIEAVDDAKNHPRGGTQTYAILIYRGTEDVYQARRQFYVKTKGNNYDTDDLIQETEPANEKGLTALSMRHMDNAMNRLSQMSYQMSTFFDREAARKDKRIEELEKGRLSTIIVMEQMLDRQQERELALRRESRMENLKDKGVNKLEQFLPLVAGKIFPSLLTANGSPELKALGQQVGVQTTIGAFFESLDKTQIKKILSILNEDEAIAFIELNSKRNPEIAFEFFDNLDQMHAQKIMNEVLSDTQRTIFMQAVADIKDYIKTKHEKAEKEQKNGVDKNEPS